MGRKVTEKADRSAEKWVREEKLRQAEVSFITDVQRHSPEFWWDATCSKVVSLKAFIQRSRQGKWVIRREDYWEGVTLSILRRSKYRAVEDRVRELEEINKVRSNTLELLRPEERNGQKIYRVAPSTMEGMIGALVKLDTLADAKRDSVLTMIEPELAKDMQKQTSSMFTNEEMQDIAHRLLEKRQEAMTEQKKIEAKPPVAEDDESDE